MRKSFSGLCASLSVALCFTAPAFAAAGQGQVEADYELLSQIPAKYEIMGTICEYLTKIRLEDQFPAHQYNIEVGIEYQQAGRTLGEIDVVVFRRSDKEAVLIGQVKCRKNMSSARHHADEQNTRFQNAIDNRHHRGHLTFRSTSDESLVVTESQMDEVQEYITASQGGGERVGFTMTVDHDLDTIHAMRTRLLRCQSRGECPNPH